MSIAEIVFVHVLSDLIQTISTATIDAQLRCHGAVMVSIPGWFAVGQQNDVVRLTLQIDRALVTPPFHRVVVLSPSRTQERRFTFKVSFGTKIGRASRRERVSISVLV